MRAPAQASRSATTVAVMILVCSLLHPPLDLAQDSTLAPDVGSASMQLPSEVKFNLAGFEAILKAAIEANDPKAQVLALDRIGALYFTYGRPGSSSDTFSAGLCDRTQTR